MPEIAREKSIASSLLSSPAEPSVLSGVKDFANGAADVFRRDVLGVQQLTERLWSYDLGANQRVVKDTAKPDAGLMFIGGTVASTVLEFAAVHAALSKITRPISAVSKLATMATSGAIVEGIKVADESKPDFAREKYKQLSAGAGSMSAMWAASAGLSYVSLFGRAGYRGLPDSIAANASAGMAAGVSHGVINSAFDGTSPHILSDLAQGAAFGTLFGVIDHRLGRARLRLTPNENAPKLPSTEELVGAKYDTSYELRSPIFTWIAENYPKLRPENYAKLRDQQLRAGLEMDLADWNAEQRVKIVDQLRKLAGRSVATDANIDAFIGGLKNIGTAPFENFGARAHEIWRRSYDDALRMKDRIAPDAKMNDLISGVDSRGNDHYFRGELRQAANDQEAWLSSLWNASERPHKLKVNQRVTDMLTKFSKDAGMQKVSAEIQPGMSADGSYGMGSFGFNPMITRDPSSARFVEVSFHEFRHHLTGSLSLDSLGRLARYYLTKKDPASVGEARQRAADIESVKPFLAREGSGFLLAKDLLDEGNKLRRALWSKPTSPEDYANHYTATLRSEYKPAALPAEIENLALRVASDPSKPNDLLFREALKPIFEERGLALRIEDSAVRLNNYVGQKSEQEAFSAGILAAIRARAWGYKPDGSKLPMPFPDARQSMGAYLANRLENMTVNSAGKFEYDLFSYGKDRSPKSRRPLSYED
jgi:hypothetical protein